MTGMPEPTDHPRRTELDAAFRASPFLAHLGGELTDWGPGTATVRLVTGPEHGNLAGTVHGGVVATVADAAFEVACNSWGRVALAAGLSVHYTAPARVGCTLTARAVEVSRGRRMGSYRLEVDDGERQVAWFQALAHRSGRWHLDEEGWPADWRQRY